MFRLFDMLGRSSGIRALDDALRTAGVHPMLVPDPVKLALIQLHKRMARDAPEGGYVHAAHLLGYCILGHDQFSENNGAANAEAQDHRVEAALAQGDTLDAKIILLSLHSGLIAPEIADRIDIEEV